MNEGLIYVSNGLSSQSSWYHNLNKKVNDNYGCYHRFFKSNTQKAYQTKITAACWLPGEQSNKLKDHTICQLKF